MLTDKWDVAHICLAVDDLAAAMDHYARALGVEWSPTIAFPAEFVVASDVFEDGVSHEGLEIAISRQERAALELACAEPGSPAFRMWGTDKGRHYVHHVAYWVHDLEAEARHLAEHGFVREMWVEPGDKPLTAYYTSGSGTRIELYSTALEPIQAKFLATGELDLAL
jgi:hypothetical protein